MHQQPVSFVRTVVLSIISDYQHAGEDEDLRWRRRLESLGLLLFSIVCVLQTDPM
jgi:hypothetical protein